MLLKSWYYLIAYPQWMLQQWTQDTFTTFTEDNSSYWIAWDAGSQNVQMAAPQNKKTKYHNNGVTKEYTFVMIKNR